MEISAIIIDDEQNNIEILRQLLQRHCPEVNILGSATHVETALQLIKEYQPELVFLDIQMPEKSGFELLTTLTDYSFEIIIVTAYDKFGIQAVKFAAVDYLLKPIDANELKVAVQKALGKSAFKKQNPRLENLIQILRNNQKKEDHRIGLPTAKETRFIKVEQIIRCQSQNNYTTFYFTNKEQVLVSKPIYEYEELLHDYGFIRCHQSHLVNKKFIRSWVKENGGYLLLEDKTQLPVSRQKKEMVLRQITND